MSEFLKYQHIERLNTQETEGITDGICHIFYKIEEQIVRDFLTDEFIKKEQAKIANYHNEGHWDALNGVYVPPPWSNKMIPELLGRVWYEFIREEISEILKKYKNPKINFRLLQSLTIKKVKKVIEV